MTLPFGPPVAPMLAKLARELPQGDYAFEPKWDGFRCLAFRDHEHVALQSRAERPMERYFPEVSAALAALPEPRFVLDGEIVVITDRGSDFDALLKRIHPAAKHVDRLAAATPASYVAFDLLALGDRDLRTVRRTPTMSRGAGTPVRARARGERGDVGPSRRRRVARAARSRHRRCGRQGA